MKQYKIREATLNDIDFIIEAIVEAEKSGSETFSYSTIFNLNEEELREIFRSMLLEEIDGCEFSISSYLIAEANNEVAATIGAWVEKSETPSSFTKSNLLAYFLPKSSLVYASKKAHITSELTIDHTPDALSFVIVYVSPAHRGNQLFELLADEHLKRHKGINELSVQLMSNNIKAIKTYERYGFKNSFEVKSDNDKIMQFLPYNKKLLMKKSL